MGDITGIGWTTSTWNPWYGCVKISPGCRNCYMYRWAERGGLDPRRVTRSKTRFRDPLKPSWRTGRRIFTCSLSDFFIAEADAWRPETWEIIRQTPQHTYLMLTKRPDRIADHLPSGWPWPHVWLGVSIETPAYLWRADVLREIPAVTRFLSLEPLLEDLGSINLEGIGWVVCGGESGTAYRPMQIAWVASIREQCVAAGVPLFVKQAAGRTAGQQGNIPDELWAYKQLGDDTTVLSPI
jgi:protein gp37